MNLILFWVLIGLGTAVLFCNVAVLIYIFYRPQKDLKDTPIILNLVKHCKYFIGSQLSIDNAKNNRKIITMEPKDISVNAKEVETANIIVDANKLEHWPMGSVSKDRTIIWALPNSATELPDQIKNTVIGKGIMWAIELQNSVNAEVASVMEGSQRKTEILKRLGDGEISKEFLQFEDELRRDTIKSVLDLKKEKPATPTLPGLVQNSQN